MSKTVCLFSKMFSQTENIMHYAATWVGTRGVLPLNLQKDNMAIRIQM